jgi:hypothetical protein
VVGSKYPFSSSLSLLCDLSHEITEQFISLLSTEEIALGKK